MAWPTLVWLTLIGISSDENNLEPHHYAFMVSFGRCNGNFNTNDYPSGIVCFPNQKNITLTVFDMITETNESKTLTKHFPFDFGSRKCCSKQKMN